VKLYKDYAILASGQILARLLGLLAFGWLARALDPEGYGAVEYMIALAALGGGFIDGGSNLIGVRRAGQGGGKLSRVGGQMVLARLVLCAVGVPVVAAVALGTIGPAVPKSLVWFFASSLLLAPWRHEWMFQAVDRNADIARAQIVRAAAFAALIWLWVKSPTDVAAAGLAEIVSVAALTAYCLYVQLRIAPLAWPGALRGFAPFMRESAAAGITNALWATSQYAPLVMIGALIGGVQTAWFAASARIVGALLVVPYIYHFGLYRAVVAALPRKQALAELSARSCRVSAWAGIFMALTLTLLAEPLTVGIMGPKLGPSAPILQIAAWVLPASLGAGHALAALAADGAQTRLLWTRLAGLGVIVAVGVAAGPSLGGTGYAFAALSGAVSLWVVAHIFATRRGLRPPSFALVLKPAVVAAVAIVGARLTGSGPWLAFGWLALYAAAAPLVDRSLLRDLSALGRATMDAQAASGT